MNNIPIYWINLDGENSISSSRRKSMLKGFRYANIKNHTRISACNYKKNPLNFNWKYKNYIKKGHNYYVHNNPREGELTLGCFMSHLKAIRTIAKDNIEYGLVLEDDMYESFYFIQHWCTDLNTIINSTNDNWSIIQLYMVNSIFLPKLIKQKNLVVKRSLISKKKCWGCNAYLVSKKYAQYIASMYKNKKWYLENPHFSLKALSDNYLYNIDPENTYIVTKAFFLESVKDSTLHNKHLSQHVYCKYIYLYLLYKYSKKKIHKHKILPKILNQISNNIYNLNRYNRNVTYEIIQFLKSFV